ncbi:MAG: glycosyltransferase family 4 protein [Planctomycetota bacterium]
MRVLCVDQTGTLGGAELSLLDLVTRWGDACGVVLFEDGVFRERLEAGGVLVEVMPLGGAAAGYKKEGGVLGQLRVGPAVLGLARRLAKKAKGFEVVYANTQKAFVVSALAGWWAKRPVVWHLRDMLTAGHFSGANRRVAVGLANRLAAKVICNSEATRDAFVEAGGRAEKAVVVHNGIDAGAFEGLDESALTVREELGAGEDYVVGVFGRLTPWKGQEVLTDAVRLMKEDGGRRVLAWVVGEALFTAEDRAYAEGLRVGADESVSMLGFRGDVPAVMRACDVVVHCSVEPEPFGRVIVEGMLAGRPVVASAAGGAAEIVRDGETGLLVEPGDVGALAGALRRLRDVAGLAERLAAAGRAEALERFSIERVAAGVDGVLAEVVR